MSYAIHSPPFFFFNDTATTEIYTLSLHDALPIYPWPPSRDTACASCRKCAGARARPRSEEHTSELQSQSNLVCRLLLEKKKTLSGSAAATRRKVLPLGRHCARLRHSHVRSGQPYR